MTEEEKLQRIKEELEIILSKLEDLAGEQKELVKEYIKELEEIRIKQIKNKLNI